MEHVKITNVLGNVIDWQKRLYANQIQISLSDLSKGTYFIELKSEDNIYFKKILLQ